LEPEKRWKIEEVLKYWMEEILEKNIFVFLYHFDTALLSNIFNHPDIRIALIQKLMPMICKEILKNSDLAKEIKFT
jgi:hypothetical protein